MSIATRRLELACPVCQSAEVYYTCTPNCCFNHVCGACGATFEPATQVAGGVLQDIAPPDPPADATSPTTGCARCDSVQVYHTEDGRLVCGACGTLLTLEMTEVHEA